MILHRRGGDTPTRRRLVLLAAVLALACAPLGSVAAAAGPPDRLAVGFAGAAAEFPPGTPAADLPIGVSWGSNVYGQIGDGSLTQRLTAVLARGGTLLDKVEVGSIDPGSSGACAIAVGKVYCWGDNSYGQLGTNNPDPSVVASPTAVGGALTGKRATAVGVGAVFACAIADGQVYCWGSNQYGQIGSNAATMSYPSPQAVYTGGALKGKVVSSLSVGLSHVCVIADGQVYCWGGNARGELGADLPDPAYYAPVAVKTDGVLKGTTVTSVAAAGNHTCAVAAGKVYCWGRNDFGQLGANTDVAQSPVPVAVSTAGVLKGLTVSSISAGGGGNTCVLAMTSGLRRAYCWGLNYYGGLGDGTNADSFVPVAVDWNGALKGKSASSISIDYGGGCVIADGKAYCWGDNQKGRLGNNSLLASPLPTAVSAGGVLAGRRLLTINADYLYTNGIAVTVPHFDDVGTTSAFYDDISWIAGAGISQGYPDKTYLPTTDVQRQAMAAFLFRFANPGIGLPVCQPADVRRFTDVPAESPFCGAVEWLVTKKITSGGGTFSPGGPVTRGVMASWIRRLHHPGLADQACTGTVFADVHPNTPSCGNIEWLASVGVTTGFADNSFKPGDSVHRDSMAAFLHRLRELTAH